MGWSSIQGGLSFLKPENGEVLFSYQDGASTIPSSAIALDRTVLIPSNGLTALDEPSEEKLPSRYGETISWDLVQEVLLYPMIRFL